jgi:hypothetical protein
MARALIVRSPSTGLTRRTFVAKEWGVIVQEDEKTPAELLIFKTEDKAQACCRSMGTSRNPPPPMVHYVERLDITNKENSK